MSKHDALNLLLAEQIAYYRALAPEYESLSIPGAGGPEVAAALDAFKPAGDEAFWSLVGDCLEPSGRVFFVDDAYRTPEELIEGEASSTIQRRLGDGTPYRAVKVPYRPADLEQQLASLGWRFTVALTSGPFYWGAGRRLRSR